MSSLLPIFSGFPFYQTTLLNCFDDRDIPRFKTSGSGIYIYVYISIDIRTVRLGVAASCFFFFGRCKCTPAHVNCSSCSVYRYLPLSGFPRLVLFAGYTRSINIWQDAKYWGIPGRTHHKSDSFSVLTWIIC